jgi:hypothetical protein
MYKKAVQTPHIWAIAYEVPAGGYALCLFHPDGQAVIEDEAEFDSLESLETEMLAIAPLEQWCEKIFAKIMS